MLHFKCRGKWFKVDDEGNMTQENNNNFSNSWKFLGVSLHNWRNGIDVKFSKDLNPKNLIKGIVFDLDHGTRRFWGGQYCGKTPRITAAYCD